MQAQFCWLWQNTTQFRVPLMRTGLNLALEPSQGLLRGWCFWASSSSLLAILHNCLLSVAEGKCLFTGCFFLSGLFGEKMIKQKNHYQLLCSGEVSGKSVLFTGLIILWSGIVLLEKCLGKAHTRVMNYKMENCCGVCWKQHNKLVCFNLIICWMPLSLVINGIQTIIAILIDSLFSPLQVIVSTNTFLW